MRHPPRRKQQRRETVWTTQMIVELPVIPITVVMCQESSEVCSNKSNILVFLRTIAVKAKNRVYLLKSQEDNPICNDNVYSSFLFEDNSHW